MNRAIVDKLARALLYEGYILYPYRPSVKNRQRWTFGGLYPAAWSEAQGGAEPSSLQAEVLVEGNKDARLQVMARFLHLVDRTVGELITPAASLPSTGEPEYRIVPVLEVGGQLYQPWQEAVDRDVDLGEFSLRELTERPLCRLFSFPASRRLEGLKDGSGQVVGVLVRSQQAIAGEVEVSVSDAGDGLRRITIRLLNRTSMEGASTAGRDDALMGALVSTHVVLGVTDGGFVSLLDPPERCRAAVAGCKNIGVWPVLVGEESQRDTMLASPIILYDHPQVAPESPGDLFDSCEIDEILTLRILTLTDEEKRAAAGVDERSRELLARTESLAREQLMGLHGTVRGLRPVPPQQEQHHG